MQKRQITLFKVVVVVVFVAFVVFDRLSLGSNWLSTFDVGEQLSTTML